MAVASQLCTQPERCEGLRPGGWRRGLPQADQHGLEVNRRYVELAPIRQLAQQILRAQCQTRSQRRGPGVTVDINVKLREDQLKPTEGVIETHTGTKPQTDTHRPLREADRIGQRQI